MSSNKRIDYTPRSQQKEDEIVLTFSPCCVCGKVIKQGYYGRYGDGGVCSKSCNTQKEKAHESFA